MKRLLILCILISVLSCKGEDNPLNYFPLDRGVTWVYKANAEQCCELTYSVISNGSTSFEGQDAYTLHYNGAECWGNNSCVLVIQEGIDYFIKQDDGIYLIGYNSKEGKTVLDSPVKVFALPAEVGAYWQSHSTGTYYGNDGSNYTRSIENDFTVISKSETVTPPAGEFNDCVQITGITYDRWYNESQKNISNIQDEVDIWYAPNIGRVKEVAKEYPPHPSSYTVSYELIEFSSASTSLSVRGKESLADLIYKEPSVPINKSILLGLGFPIFSLSIFF